MKTKKYDVLLWDVDGTLLNFSESEKWALREAFRSYGIEIDDEIIAVYSAINDSLWKKLERGEVEKQHVLLGRFQQLFREFSPTGKLAKKEIDVDKLASVELTEFQQKYQRNLGSVYYYTEDSLTLCKKLKEEGFLQYIITNGVEWTQRNKLHLAGFDQVMDDLFISEVIGYNKPDVRFFDACLGIIKENAFFEEHKFDITRFLVIGDSMTSDMKGADNAGIDSCLYMPAEKNAEKETGVTYQIAKLWDVEKIIWQNQRDKN